MDGVYGGPRGEDRGEKRAAVVSFFYYYDSFSEWFDFLSIEALRLPRRFAPRNDKNGFAPRNDKNGFGSRNDMR